MVFVRSATRGSALCFALVMFPPRGCHVAGSGPVADETTVRVAHTPPPRRVCPLSCPVMTWASEPPHTLAGECLPEDPGQLRADEADMQMIEQCTAYCGQNDAQCGVSARVVGARCADRNGRHRWGGTCVCE